MAMGFYCSLLTEFPGNSHTCIYSLGHIQLQGMLGLRVFILGNYISPEKSWRSQEEKYAYSSKKLSLSHIIFVHTRIVKRK